MVEKIVSRVQTGADRGAQEAALRLGLSTGGALAPNRQADGRITPQGYPDLADTEATRYVVGTAANVEDSDATVIVSFGALTGGTKLA